MACFVAPATVAIVTTTIRKKVPEKFHIDWLLLMLLGGVLMSIVDHIANGELVPYFPFFTGGWHRIGIEILKTGVPMTAVILVAWSGMVLVANATRNSLEIIKSR